MFLKRILAFCFHRQLTWLHPIHKLCLLSSNSVSVWPFIASCEDLSLLCPCRDQEVKETWTVFLHRTRSSSSPPVSIPGVTLCFSWLKCPPNLYSVLQAKKASDFLSGFWPPSTILTLACPQDKSHKDRKNHPALVLSYKFWLYHQNMLAFFTLHGFRSLFSRILSEV